MATCKAMLDEHSEDGLGWARFSEDRRLRYRLRRQIDSNTSAWASRAVFVMLNPSTADAFKLDPTVLKCRKFTRLWGMNMLEVVNLFALRSPYPKDLDLAHARGEDIGMDAAANLEIVEACKGASIVVAAWGNNGVRHGRDKSVRDLLWNHSIVLRCLGTTNDGHPLHPLARGKSWIEMTREPVLL